jgi:hypothetical protein
MVIAPVFWLYIIVVVNVISFSIVVLCIFISLLFIWSGIMYVSVGDVISAIRIILLDGENISFDASLVMYINSTSIPPIMIIKRMYENQNLLYMVPLIRHVIMVCMSSIIPMASGCFICVNIILVIILIDIISFVISGGILFKILVLGINEMALCLSSEVLKVYSLFLVYKTNIFIKLLKLNVNVVLSFFSLFLWYLGFFFWP